MGRLKRTLYLTHRWLGIVLCLFMAMWFVSGVVMMYVGYPKLTPSERLNGLPALDLRGCCIAPAQALAATGADQRPVRELRLATVLGEPSYLIVDDRGGHHAVRAHDGAQLDTPDAARAEASARQFAPSAQPRFLRMVDEDAWTHSRALDVHRPLALVALDDAAGTEVYVSSRTGEVVRDSDRSERFWNWFGAWIHWLYPFRGGVLDAAWAQIVIWLSVAGTIAALTGTVVGVLRWRFRGTYKSGMRSPYRDTMMRWHHWTGLVFAVATILWIFSGLMSMNPWKLFNADAPRPDLGAFTGGPLAIARFERSPAEAIRMSDSTSSAREIVWGQLHGEPYYVVYEAAGRTRLVSARANGPVLARFDTTTLIEAAATLYPGTGIASHEWLERYDFYYYDRAPHTMLGHVERRLPMLRVKFTDTHDTWVHIDPYTGTVHNRVDRLGRIKRWLFALFHSWDWLPLLQRRPLWDIVLIVLSIGGLLSSVTGVVIGWRRLRRVTGPERRALPVGASGNA